MEARQQKLEAPPLIVIANDQEWSSRSLETILGPRGYATVRAYTGRQAIELMRDSRADGAVIDLSLPDVSGLDVCRLLREQPGFRQATPLLVVTSGATTRAQRIEALTAGAWDLLSEPLDAESLLLKLDLYVRAKRESDHSAESGLLDQETGLYNATGLARRAREVGAELARRREPIGCAVMQLKASDAAPESAADLVGVLSQACQRVARTSDLIGRLGRTDVVLVAPGTNRQGLDRLIDRVRAVVESGAQGAPAPQLLVGREVVADYSTVSEDVISLVLHAADGLRGGRAGLERAAP